jgi:uncharacterized protein (UPF0305 family)
MRIEAAGRTASSVGIWRRMEMEQFAPPAVGFLHPSRRKIYARRCTSAIQFHRTPA